LRIKQNPPHGGEGEPIARASQEKFWITTTLRHGVARIFTKALTNHGFLTRRSRRDRPPGSRESLSGQLEPSASAASSASASASTRSTYAPSPQVEVFRHSAAREPGSARCREAAVHLGAEPNFYLHAVVFLRAFRA
jgi:hypothetical protein